MGEGDTPTTQPSNNVGYELGRLVGEFASMNRTVQGMSSELSTFRVDLKNVATKEDIAKIEAVARDALSKAEKAHARLDGWKWWSDIAKMILPYILIGGIIFIVLKGGVGGWS